MPMMMTYGGGKSPSEKTMMLKENLEMAYDNRASVSNNYRKRIEIFKKSSSRTKNLKRVTRIFEKPRENDWITSGGLGSRDAVLVFRTSILQPETKETTTSTNTSTGDDNDQQDVNNKMKSSSDSSLNVEEQEEDGEENEDMNMKEMIIKIPTSKRFVRCTNLTVCNIKAASEDPVDSNDSLLSSSNSEEMIESSSVSKGIVGGGRGGYHHRTKGGDDNNCNRQIDKRFQSTKETPERRNTGNCGVICMEDKDNKEETEEQQQQQQQQQQQLDQNSSKSENTEDDYDDYSPAPGMPATELQITYKFQQTETLLLRRIFTRHGLTEVGENENFNILWTGVHMKPDILRNLTPYQRVNHFPRSYELTRKDRLYKNIERMQHLRGFKQFDIVPQSFLLPVEYRDLVSAHNKSRGPWIVKPAASSRGRGIFIVTSPDQIPPDEPVLVSKYVADPLCINGHKCDVRVYVLVTSFDPLLIYMYEEGLVRLATVKYNLNADNLWNPCMHLCNYSINKYHTDYVKSSDAQDEDVGHKWTLSALLRHLKLRNCDTRLLMANIEDLIIKTLLCCAQPIIAACRMFVPNGNNCFELYGFDILIDTNLKPWLLEVNLSPSIGIDSPLDAKVKASMLTDLLTCVGIPALTPSMRKSYDSKWTRFRNLSQTRRTNSLERTGWKRSNNNSGGSGSGSGGGGVGGGCGGVGGNPSNGARPLTADEQRILRSARSQEARRGGFVRIFPTEFTMSRYGSYLDPTSGIPISTAIMQGQTTFQPMVVPHNHNQMLFNSLFAEEIAGNSSSSSSSASSKKDLAFDARMEQYERALENCQTLSLGKKRTEPKCEEEGKRLRKQMLNLIDTGIELTQLQARQIFSLYLECILQRICQESRDCHEKIILKFLNRFSGGVRAPVFFRNSQNIRVVNKAHSAMVAKLLYDFLDQYNRDTEAYVDCCDHYGLMIPSNLFMEFLSQAQEADLEAVLTMHTNLNGTMPYLYNRCGISVPPTPPIPSGVHGFLKALPAMVQSPGFIRDYTKNDHRNVVVVGDRDTTTNSVHNSRLSERSSNLLTKGGRHQKEGSKR